MHSLIFLFAAPSISVTYDGNVVETYLPNEYDEIGDPMKPVTGIRMIGNFLFFHFSIVTYNK